MEQRTKWKCNGFAQTAERICIELNFSMRIIDVRCRKIELKYSYIAAENGISDIHCIVSVSHRFSKGFFFLDFA